jgi:hypothetical protein
LPKTDAGGIKSFLVSGAGNAFLSGAVDAAFFWGFASIAFGFDFAGATVLGRLAAVAFLADVPYVLIPLPQLSTVFAIPAS